MINHLPRIALGLAAMTVATSLTITNAANSYALLGFNLGTGQRDFRVHDDFSDAASNNNQTPDPNWPSYQGVDMAMWKSGAEWGSRNFGDGSGDPTQNAIGDGGANFNFVWNGDASGEGSYNYNIIHAVPGSGGGAIAWCYPSSNGWKIEFADGSFNFADGPGTIPGSQMDLQNVNCHELGHALGLDHSSVGAATMYYATGNGSVGFRSIHSDDKSGVQAIYGVRDANMPKTDDIQGSTSPGGTCVVVGSNYTATGNGIWFNSDVLDGQQNGGTAYKIQNLNSSNNGTQISFTVPTSGIEDGSIHVKNDIGGQPSLGEGHPIAWGTGGGNNNTINLSGTTSAQAGQNCNWSWSGAPGNSNYGVLYSLSNTGMTYNGHSFDVGSNYTLHRTGRNSAAGSGSLTATIPGHLSNLTVYLEVGAQDSAGLYDSNLLTLNIN